MKPQTDISILQLRGALLRDVSRSFYLSLRLLPRQLRDPISLAYLLARATDSIADAAELKVNLRLERLRQLADVIQRGSPLPATDSLRSLSKSLNDPAERSLIEKLPACLAWLQALPREDQAEIRDVLALINEGQRLDVERFQNPAHLTALESASDLDRYTYLVAGCVGEFWTHVCFRRLTKFSAQPRETMQQWGVNFGKGLQLVNILRDIGTDLRNGRCYLPAAELGAIGLSPSDLKRDPSRAGPILQVWRERAEEGIAAGIEYACAIEPWRVRLATALPALLGARTLALLREAGPAVFERRIKMERAEVRRILFTLVGRMASRKAIRSLHATLSS